MKLSFLKIKSFFIKFCLFFKINPHKHWAMLLYFFSLIIIVLMFLSFYFLYEIKNEQIFQVKSNNESKETILKESSLNNVINTFENKASKEQMIVSSPAKYKDPSF